MSLRRTLYSTACLAAVLAAALPAQAENTRGARPFAPWMALDDSLKQRRPQPDLHDIQAVPQARGTMHLTAAANGKAPKGPLITPADTQELIDQIYGGSITMKTSPLENAYSRRIVDELQQFGYDMFGAAGVKDADKTNAFALPAGAAQDDFLLNMGDRLDVTFRGQRQDRKTYTIDSQGLQIVDDLPPIPASGRTIGEVRGALAAEVSKLYNTEIFLALDSVRQVNVLVVGHVGRPGRQTLTVFNTVLDALGEAEGVQKTGSLRQIKLVRNGRSTIVDLYSLLVHGSAIMDISLRDGDRIIVPPVGPTVAIAGGVKRPGIYEILPGLSGGKYTPQGDSQSLSLQAMLTLAGGILSPGQNRFLRMGLTADGREDVKEIKDTQEPAFTDGSILTVAASSEARTGTVELIGHTRRPGLHALDQTPSLSALIDNEKVFGPDIYPLIGVIERFDSDMLSRALIAFPPLQVLKGQYDRKLQDGDVVHLFSRAAILNVAKNGRKDPVIEAAYGSADADEEGLSEDPVLTSFLKERSAFVRGAVRQEGAWPVADGATLDNLLAVAGGATLEASTSDIEVTSRAEGRGTQRADIDLKDTAAATIAIAPGDSVRVKQKFNRVAENSVLIIGEVLNPGRYDIKAGDRMSDLLRRAGGLTGQAYPDGAIFSRNTERRAEEARFKAQAQELESRLAASLQKEKGAPGADQIASVQELAAELRNAEGVGRITVEADPSVLSVEPELDILLEAGDRIHIPRRPLTVRVAGEVLSPAALQFRKEKDPRAYVMEAGGFTYDADTTRVFVVYPDGSAQPLSVNAWNHMPVMIPPGSTVVVPRDPKPFDFIQTAKDVSQILSNLAITGIFINDMKNDD